MRRDRRQRCRLHRYCRIGRDEHPRPEDLVVQRRLRSLYSEEDLERMQADKTPEGIAKLKQSILRVYPDLPEPFITRLAEATTSDQLDAWVDAIARDGRRTHFKTREVFRGPKTDSIMVQSEFTDCGFYFQIGETYLVYAHQDKDTGLLRTGACSRTKRVSDAGEDLTYLFFLQKEAPNLRGSAVS